MITAGRVGVNPQEVDSITGKITGGGGTTVNVIDALNSTSATDALSAKQGRVLNNKFGTLEFRVNDGVAQYKLNGEWVNFNSGDGELGINIPSPLYEGITGVIVNSGGYQVDSQAGICYVNMNITNNSNSIALRGLPNSINNTQQLAFLKDGTRFSYSTVSNSGGISAGPNSNFNGTYDIVGMYLISI